MRVTNERLETCPVCGFAIIEAKAEIDRLRAELAESNKQIEALMKAQGPHDYISIGKGMRDYELGLCIPFEAVESGAPYQFILKSDLESLRNALHVLVAQCDTEDHSGPMIAPAEHAVREGRAALAALDAAKLLA